MYESFAKKGELLINSLGLIVEFTPEFEDLVKAPGIEIYEAPISDYVSFKEFESVTAERIIYSDGLRLGRSKKSSTATVSRAGTIKTTKGDRFSARLEISLPPRNILFQPTPRYRLTYYVLNQESEISTEKLPNHWGPIANFVISLWQKERTLALLLLSFALWVITLVYFPVSIPNENGRSKSPKPPLVLDKEPIRKSNR